MVYRIQVREGARWFTLGLDCLTRSDVRAALAMLPHGAVHRVVVVPEC